MLIAVYTIVWRGGFVLAWMYGKRNRSACRGWAGRMESSATNCGVWWYGRYVKTSVSVLYSWTLAVCQHALFQRQSRQGCNGRT